MAGTIGVVSMAARVLPAIEGVTIARAAGPVALAGRPDCRRPARFCRCAALRCDDCLRRPRLASAGPGCRYAHLPAQPRSASCRLRTRSLRSSILVRGLSPRGWATSTAERVYDVRSLLRQAGLAQTDEIGGFEQGAGLRDTPISVGHYLGDARKRTCAQQPAGLGKFSAGPLGLAF